MANKLILCLPVLFNLLLAACSASESPGSIKSTYWELNTLTELSNNTIIVKPTIEFTNNGALVGFGGCNKFTGMYKVSSNRLTTSDIVSTEMACENSQVESVFISALMKNDTYEIEGSKLYLYSNGKVTAVLSKIRKY